MEDGGGEILWKGLQLYLVNISSGWLRLIWIYFLVSVLAIDLQALFFGKVENVYNSVSIQLGFIPQIKKDLEFSNKTLFTELNLMTQILSKFFDTRLPKIIESIDVFAKSWSLLEVT